VFKTRKDPSLLKIMIGVALVVVVTAAGLRAYHWFTVERGGRLPEDAATELAQIRELVAAGGYDEARQRLAPFTGRLKDPSYTPEALMLLAEIDVAQGDKPAALELLRRAKEEFPTSPWQPRAAIAYAKLLDGLGQSDEAKREFERVRDESPPAVRAAALIELGHEAQKQGERLEARDTFRQAFNDAEWNSDVWNEALDALGRINIDLIFSPTETPDSKSYIVEKGDSLNGIGIKLNTTQGLLIRANGLDDPTRLQLGQRLKFTPKDFRIVIERSTCRLFLLDKDGIFKRYFAGLGKPGHETTLGTYRIGNKQKDPTWHKPSEGPIPPGDPRNELGTRWMPLVPIEEGLPTDLGIHGTIKPETIGTFASMGCARLLQEDVEELFDLVVRSTPVYIVDVFNAEDFL